jgi:hypothetical protein
VGQPLLALVEVLKMGRTLAARISVDGVWRMETETELLLFFALPQPSIFGYEHPRF